MSQLEPIQVPLGVMQSLHRLETLAYHPGHNEAAGDEIAWTDDEAPPGSLRRSIDVAGNIALIAAALLAIMMVLGWAAAIVAGRVH